VIVSSDLRRAAETAEPLSRLTGLPVSLDKDLRERHGGEWEGLTDRDIRERYPAEHATWSPPGGESGPVISSRVVSVLERIAEDLPGGGLAVVVSHGAAIRLGMARLLGFPEELWGALGPLSNCSWSLIGSGRRGWRVLEHNAGTLPEPVLGDDR
jgi:probable phosphoglycerate mutase